VPIMIVAFLNSYTHALTHEISPFASLFKEWQDGATDGFVTDM
jgi:hypothetical protein